MEEIEEAFTLRQFHEALKGANQILFEKSSESHCRRNATAKCCSSIDGGVDRKFHHDDKWKRNSNDRQVMLLDVPMYYFPEPQASSKPSSSPSLSIPSIPSGAPTSTSTPTSTPISTPAPLFFKATLQLQSTNQEAHVEESTAASAAVIAIQSSFELLKQRIQKRRKQKLQAEEKAANKRSRCCMDEELIMHIQPFFQLYSTVKHEKEAQIIPFDVLLTFIKFMYAVGSYTTCVEMIFSIIDQIMSKRDCVTNTTMNIDIHRQKEEEDSVVKVLDYGGDGNHDDHHDELHEDHAHDTKFAGDEEESTSSRNEILWDYCHECFHLLLIDILPLIPKKEQRHLECILNQFIDIMNRSPSICQRNNKEENQPYLRKLCSTNGDRLYSSNPSLSSLQVIHQSIQCLLRYSHRTDNGNDNDNNNVDGVIIQSMSMKELIIDSLRDVCYSLREEASTFEYNEKHDRNRNNHENGHNQNTKNHESSSSSLPLLSSSLNNLSSIVDSLSNELSIKGSDHDNKEKEDREEASMASRLANDYIIKPLWTSEGRWMNRVKVLSVGFVSYSILSKRRRLTKATRRLGNIIVSPLQEIASALKDIAPPE